MRTALVLIASLCFAFTSVAAPAAPAAAAKPPDDDTVAAKRFFTEAQSLYKQARYSEAIGKFEEAYRVRPHPAILFNVGRCYEQLNDVPQALRNYREYLRTAPVTAAPTKERSAVLAAISALEKKLKDQGVQQLLVSSEPDGARVSIDNRPYGLTPLAVEIKPGSHQISVSKENYETLDRSIVLSPDKSLEVAFTFKAPLVATPPLNATPVTTNVGPPPPLPPLTKIDSPITVPSVVTQSSPRTRVWTWVFAGLTVGAVASGIITGSIAKGDADKLHKSVHTQGDAQLLYDQGNTMQLGANISYIAAGAFGITAVILFFLEPHSTRAGGFAF